MQLAMYPFYQLKLVGAVYISIQWEHKIWFESGENFKRFPCKNPGNPFVTLCVHLPHPAGGILAALFRVRYCPGETNLVITKKQRDTDIPHFLEFVCWL